MTLLLTPYSKAHHAFSRIATIAQVQNALNMHDAMLKVLPNLTKSSDNIVREVLSFLASMLFNGNKSVQGSLLDYFQGTREEKFFVAVKTRISMSSMAWKENQALIYQQQTKVKEIIAELKDIHRTMKEGRVSAEAIGASELGSMLLALQASKCTSSATGKSTQMSRNGYSQGSIPERRRPQKAITKSSSTAEVSKNEVTGMRNMANDGTRHAENHVASAETSNALTGASSIDNGDIEELAMRVVMENENLEMKDDGYIELVLRVLAYICDGQNKRLQDYLREQPDNIKSIDLVAETARFLGLTYTSINKSNISLIIQIFDTLVEFASGNLSNQAVCYDNKVCDYINYLLRSKQLYTKCGLQEEIEMKKSIANLIMAMIEENVKLDRDHDDADMLGDITVSAAQTEKRLKPIAGMADEVKDSIDTDSIRSVFINCYRRHLNETLDNETREDIIAVGFKFFHIFLRLEDLDHRQTVNFETMIDKDQDADKQRLIWDFYRSSTMSIEVLKDDNLQKVYFRAKDKKVLRKEVKDRFKYEVDRSSPNNKLRDFSDWIREIMNDIRWQKRVLRNPLGSFLVHGWKTFNIAAILLSLAISVIVLSSWKVPESLSDRVPVSSEGAIVAIYVLGVLHNIISMFILISFFLCNKPYVPTMQRIRIFWFRLLGIGFNYANENKCNAEGKLQASVFSFTTFYYIIFFIFSILGTVFYGYFFAFHLLHIANHNQLLVRVFQAITRNGMSLAWVLIYSLTFFYIYALLSFAFYRDIFDSTRGNFCETMYQCMVTVIRRGLNEGMYDEADYLSVPANQTFTYHAVKGIFDLFFFIIITTIGLNIIFGIIVDTFSELRDSKWQIDQDMKSVCFICSRNAYEFEHHGEGFEKHVKDEHNQWAYLFFMLYLDETRFTDYTAIELFVWRHFDKRRLDFFPLNKSIRLEAGEESQDEVKLETLLSQVLFLVHKSNEEDLKMERERERKRQQKWEEQHKK